MPVAAAVEVLEPLLLWLGRNDEDSPGRIVCVECFVQATFELTSPAVWRVADASLALQVFVLESTITHCVVVQRGHCVASDDVAGQVDDGLVANQIVDLPENLGVCPVVVLERILESP